MLNRSEAERSRRLLGSENAGTDDNDVENACLSMCFHPRICLKAYTGISCRNGRLATTNPWSERTGGQTSPVGVQSSQVMTTSSQPPSLCVGTNTCCVSPNCSSICRKLMAEEEEGVSSWRFKSPRITTWNSSVEWNV